MSPSAEQVVKWAREAGGGPIFGDNEWAVMGTAELMEFAKRAYQAGAMDENAGCYLLCSPWLSGNQIAMAIRERAK